jgi:5-methylcytosine-specific restriction endonuclease McrA
MHFEIEVVTEKQVKREKEKARNLRRTHWWDKKTQSGICHYCRRRVGRDQLTMDHIVPLSRGGKSKKGNIVPACKNCNSKKKSLLPVEWEEYVKSLAKIPPAQ